MWGKKGQGKADREGEDRGRKRDRDLKSVWPNNIFSN